MDRGAIPIRRNLMWMLGGDYARFVPDEAIVERALIDGMKSVSGQASVLHSAEWDSGTIGTDPVDFGDEVYVNGVLQPGGGDGFAWATGLRLHTHDARVPARGTV